MVDMSSQKKKPTKDDAQKTTPPDEQQALTERELEQVNKQSKPGWGKMVGISIALAALGGGALATGVGMVSMHPSEQTMKFPIPQPRRSPTASARRFIILKACSAPKMKRAWNAM